MSLILNKAQAEAVYSAMCALEKAGVIRFSGVIPGKDADGSFHSIEVVRMRRGDVVVEKTARVLDMREHYADQSAFAIVYGLS